jgi:hypothetical protein
VDDRYADFSDKRALCSFGKFGREDERSAKCRAEAQLNFPKANIRAKSFPKIPYPVGGCYER